MKIILAMSNQKITRYNLDAIDAKGATINIIYGERANGKSYQVKHKKAVEKYLKTGKRFILMRRWKEEISTIITLRARVGFFLTLLYRSTDG